MNIYQINKKYIDLAIQLENDELTPEIEQELFITEEQFKEKSIAYGCVTEGINAEINAIDELIEKLQAKKKAKQKVINNLKQRVLTAMEIFGIFKIESPVMTLSIRKSESVEIVNEHQIPEEYKRTKTEVAPDKTKIKAALKEGKEINGAFLSINSSLQIK